MAKRCPPGVICIENITITLVILIVGSILLFLNLKNNSNSVNERIIIKENNNSNTGLFSKPNYSFSNLQNDVLLNPYEAPLRDDRYIRASSDPRGIPINIPTQSIDTSYRQVGILTRINGNNEMILPLMGRPLFSNRDKWNFYTMSDKNNMIKLPVTVKGKSATNEYGVDNLYNGDTVYVEGYNDAFKVTVYDNQVQRYIPFL
jgi:hypothetical protein